MWQCEIPSSSRGFDNLANELDGIIKNFTQKNVWELIMRQWNILKQYGIPENIYRNKALLNDYFIQRWYIMNFELMIKGKPLLKLSCKTKVHSNSFPIIRQLWIRQVYSGRLLSLEDPSHYRWKAITITAWQKRSESVVILNQSIKRTAKEFWKSFSNIHNSVTAHEISHILLNRMWVWMHDQETVWIGIEMHYNINQIYTILSWSSNRQWVSRFYKTAIDFVYNSAKRILGWKKLPNGREIFPRNYRYQYGDFLKHLTQNELLKIRNEYMTMVRNKIANFK